MSEREALGGMAFNMPEWLERKIRNSRSKYRPHTAKSGSREAARRRRQIEKGMLQVSEPWERKELSRAVRPNRNKRYL